MKTLKSLLLASFCCLGACLWGQNPNQGPPQGPPQGTHGPGARLSIQEMATQKAMELKPLLGLNETQVKAIYLIHISQLQEMQKDMEVRRARMDSLRRQGPPDSAALATRGPRPQGMGPGGPGRDPDPQMMARMQKQRSQQDSLYKMVLTPEQYAQWQAYEKDRMEKMRQEMQQRQGGQAGTPRRNPRTTQSNDGFFDRNAQNSLDDDLW